MPLQTLEEELAHRRLAMPPGLAEFAAASPFPHAEDWLIRSFVATHSGAFDLLNEDAPENLLPIAMIDDSSYACVVCAPIELSDDRGAGLVVRWHLDDVLHDAQARLLDTDIMQFVRSLDDELAAREPGLVRMLDQIGPAYQGRFLAREKKPRDFVVRPIRLACQNVIVGLAAIAQDSNFDGLSVVAWQTCEVSHLATHEANRALTALVLCDAFQNGGTMEIRFDRPVEVSSAGQVWKYLGHPEGTVPASLRRYGRVVGVQLGADPGSISPTEARELFLAVTPMPPSLRHRVVAAVDELGLSPERLCFTLMSQIWREIELEFMLATSDRCRAILEGGAAWTHRIQRIREMETTRTALMVGMLFRRLDGVDRAGAGDVRMVEDRAVGVTWQIDDTGVIQLSGLAPGIIPWARSSPMLESDTLSVVVASRDTPEVAALAAATALQGQTLLVVPQDVTVSSDTGAAVVARAPDRVADLDQAAERKLHQSRTVRR